MSASTCVRLVLLLACMVAVPAANRHHPPRVIEDPVPAIDDADRALLAKPDAKAFKLFFEHYIDRIEAWHTAHSAPAPRLLACLKAHPDFRRDVWTALNIRDNAKAALGILETLRAKDEAKLVTFCQLAIAIAVVHDQPRNVTTSRLKFLWGVEPTQFAAPLSWEEIWTFFTDPKRQALFVFKPNELVWPLLVNLADLDVTREDIDWATKTFATRKGKLGVDVAEFYSMVPYDYKKLNRKETNLGQRPYSLENLKQYGGVCVDQGHFASRVAKIFGVPSMKCAGDGRYGGAGHSWSGFLAFDAKANAVVLRFTGRYQYDFYYVGDYFDVQTGTGDIDRSVELFYDGVSAKRYESYITASVLTRAALKLEKDQPALAQTLVLQAVKTNLYVDEAWKLVMRLAASHAIPIKDADALWQILSKAQAMDHPDLVATCLPSYLEAVGAENFERRHRIYLDAYRAFDIAKRPDLQIQIRLRHLDELAKKDRHKDVIQLAFDTVSQNVKEGALIMPLVECVVTLSKEFAAKDKTFRLQAVKDGLAKFANEFPKKRGNDVSPAWREFEKLMHSL